MKSILFLIAYFGLSLQFYFPQNIKVRIIDSEENKPLQNVRIMSDNVVLHSNDDGEVELKNDKKPLNIFAQGYEELTLESLTPIIKLKPLYKDIEEVKISKIDIRQMFQNALKDYLSIYYSKPSLYQSTIKQKGYIDGKMINLLIANIDIWALANAYNFKAQDNVDSFVQIGFNNIKYFKTKVSSNDYPFNTDIQITPKNFIQKLFFNSEIIGFLNDTKNSVFVSKILSENQNIQIIYFETKDEINTYKGKFTYSKTDKVISSFDLYITNMSQSFKNKNKRGEAYEGVATSNNIKYDFYKKDGKYLPALVYTEIKGYALYKEKKYPVSFIQEINFQKFLESDKKGLKNKIDLNKNLTENIANKEIKENNTLLSKEEQKFIDEP